MNARRGLQMILAAAMFAALVPMVSAEIADHVVISEVQIKQDEFVELYNPTGSNVNMSGWHWCYFSHNRDWNNSHKVREFPDGATIQAYSYYLISVHGTVNPAADWNISSVQLSNSDGSVAIFSWNPKENETAGEAEAGCIDAVGWGSVGHVYENATTVTPSKNKSIERKANETGAIPGYGNAWDTDNNSNDFVLREVPNPRNASSGHLPLLPEPATITLISIGLMMLVCIASFKRLKNE